VDSNGDVRRRGNFRADKFSEWPNNWRLSFHEVPEASSLHHTPGGGSAAKERRGRKRGPGALLSDSALALPATPAPVLNPTQLFDRTCPAPSSTPAPGETASAASPALTPGISQKVKVARVTCEPCGQKEVNKKSLKTHEKSAKCIKLTQRRAAKRRLFQ